MTRLFPPHTHIESARVNGGLYVCILRAQSHHKDAEKFKRSRLRITEYYNLGSFTVFRIFFEVNGSHSCTPKGGIPWNIMGDRMSNPPKRMGGPRAPLPYDKRTIWIVECLKSKHVYILYDIL